MVIYWEIGWICGLLLLMMGFGGFLDFFDIVINVFRLVIEVCVEIVLVFNEFIYEFEFFEFSIVLSEWVNEFVVIF